MKEILINVEPLEKRIALLENKNLVEFSIERPKEQKIAGNIYKGRVIRILPGIQSAFVDLGLKQKGFLYVKDYHEDLTSFLEMFTEGWEKSEKEKFFLKPSATWAIQDVLKEGQEILVQVIKEPIRTKGPKLSSYISLPGRYLVLLPDIDSIAISRRIKDVEERNRLKRILEEIKPKSTGLIVRTMGAGKQKREFLKDINFLTSLWEKIKSKAEKVQAPTLLYQENNFAFKIARDIFKDDVKKVIIDSEKIYQEVLNCIERNFSPLLKTKLKLHTQRKPLFEFYDLEREIRKSLEKKVFLKSGGYIVIEQTEALCSIDVNTGRYLGRKNLEETAFAINLEAAKEIAHQIRLRNISGLIVVDFIDLKKSENRNKLFSYLKEILKKDPVEVHLLSFTGGGTVEITRKRITPDLPTLLFQECPYCEGRGKILKRESIAANVIREVKKIAPQNKGSEIRIEINPQIARHLREEPVREVFQTLEQLYNISITFHPNESFHLEKVKIISLRTLKELF
jgi:ribonuclease G